MQKEVDLYANDENFEKRVMPVYLFGEEKDKQEQIAKSSADEKYFPRTLNDSELRKDFIQRLAGRVIQSSKKNDAEFERVLETIKIPGTNKSIFSQLAPVHNCIYRMRTYWQSNKSPKINIIVSWLLLFMSSLEYQLNPYVADKNEDRINSSAISFFKSVAFFNSQAKLEQLFLTTLSRR